MEPFSFLTSSLIWSSFGAVDCFFWFLQWFFLFKERFQTISKCFHRFYHSDQHKPLLQHRHRTYQLKLFHYHTRMDNVRGVFLTRRGTLLFRVREIIIFPARDFMFLIIDQIIGRIFPLLFDILNIAPIERPNQLYIFPVFSGVRPS